MNDSATEQLTWPQKNVVVSSTLVVSFYILLTAAAELVGVFVDIAAGAAFDGLLIVVLLGHSIAAPNAPYRRLLVGLSLIPLLRVLSVAMPIRIVPPLYWYVLIGAPLILAIGLAARPLKLRRRDLGLQRVRLSYQLLLGVAGVPLGILAYAMMGPQSLTSTIDAGELVVGALLLTIFASFAEELLFRGLVQHLAVELFGNGGIVCSALLSAIVYFGSLSWMYALFMFAVSFLFGLSVKRTGSIWGAVLAHTTLNIVAILILPLLRV